MKYKIIQVAGYVWGAIVLLLCGLAFFKQFYPVAFLDVQIASLLQNVWIYGGITAILLLLFLVALTLLFGRVYCAVICPLGILQEFLMLLFKPFYKWRKIKAVQKYSWIVYFFTAIVFGVMFGGSVLLLAKIDPYAVFGSALSGAKYGIGFIAVLSILVLFKKRFFCTHLCPVGAVLGLLARFSLRQIRIDEKACKTCHLCENVCPAGCIDLEKHSIKNEACVRCFKCVGCCPHGALYFGCQKKEEKTVDFSLQRRQFILGSAAFLVFVAACKNGALLAKSFGGKIKNVILPAGAGRGPDFANRCLNCNLCVENCPMKIIKKATSDVPFVHLKYGKAYCNYDCHKCSEVCPSGAIKKISLAEKRQTKIANAVIDEDICIKCGHCVHMCPRKIIIKKRGEYPIIRYDACIGCGACATVCPVQAITIKTIDEQKILN